MWLLPAIKKINFDVALVRTTNGILENISDRYVNADSPFYCIFYSILLHGGA